MRRPRLALAVRFARARAGAVAVEFGFVAPLLLLLFFGGYAVSQAVGIGRKITITTRALADLTTQVATLSAAQMTTLISASTQIIAPYDASPLGLRLSEITVDSTGKTATVTWSIGQNMTAYVKAASFTLPSSMLTANTSYIYSETQYTFTPIAGFGPASFTLGDRMYMLPRLSTTVAYTG